METCWIEGCNLPIFVKARGWCRKHYSRWWKTGDPLTPTKEYVRGEHRWRRLYVVEPSGCWRWTGSLDKYGYGQYDERSTGGRINRRAHRFVYQQLVRVLASGEELDHLCRNHACVNPDHLEPVTHLENVRRGDSGQHNAVKMHCPQGHPYDEENTIVRARGWRGCRACVREQGRINMRRLRERRRTQT